MWNKKYCINYGINLQKPNFICCCCKNNVRRVIYQITYPMNHQIRENPPLGDLCKKLCKAPVVLLGNSYTRQPVPGTAGAEYAHCCVCATVRIRDVKPEDWKRVLMTSSGHVTTTATVPEMLHRYTHAHSALSTSIALLIYATAFR